MNENNSPNVVPAPLPPEAKVTLNSASSSETNETRKNIHDILSYLDKCDNDKKHSAKPVSLSLPPSSCDSSSTVVNTSSSSNMVYLIKSQLVELKLESKKKSAIIDVLTKDRQKDIDSLTRELAESKTKSEALMLQKHEEYEHALKRQLDFVDKLLSDKAKLTEHADDIMKQLETQRRQSNTMLMERQQQWTSQTMKLREQWQNDEISRREIWQHDKQRILQATLHQATETKMKNAAKNHAKHVVEVEQRMQTALDQQKDLLLQEAQNRVAALRIKMTRDKDTEIRLLVESANREKAEQLLCHQREIESTRRKLLDEAANERHQLIDEKRRELRDFENELCRVRAVGEEKLERQREQCREELEECRRKERVTMKRAQEANDIDREEWQCELTTTMKKASEKELLRVKENLRRERDEQIGVVVERISTETAKTQAKIENEAKMNAERSATLLRESNEEWVKKYEQSMQVYKDMCIKYESIKNSADKLREETNCSRTREETLTARLSRCEADKNISAREWKVRLDDLTANYEQRILHETKETQKIQAQQNELKISMQEQRKELESKQSLEIEQLDAKVRAAMSAKDSAIMKLKEQIELRDSKIQHMNALLAQHQRELLNTFQ